MAPLGVTCLILSCHRSFFPLASPPSSSSSAFPMILFSISHVPSLIFIFILFYLYFFLFSFTLHVFCILYYGFPFSVFMGFLNLWISGSLFVVPSLGLFSFCVFVLSICDISAFGLPYYITLYFISAVFNMWVASPLGVKWQLLSRNEKFIVGCHHNMKTSHCPSVA